MATVRVGNGYRVCVLRDLNGWIRNKVWAGITGRFCIPGKNDNGRRVIDSCAEKGSCVGSTYF